MVAPILLWLQNICVVVREKTDYAGDKLVLIMRTPCKFLTQKLDLAYLCAIQNKIHLDCVLLLPLVSIDHLLPKEQHHLCANLDLHSTDLVADATAAPVACPRTQCLTPRANTPLIGSYTKLSLAFRSNPNPMQNSSSPKPSTIKTAL